jgi:uncharacterized damage-inducible protein DinB
MRILTLTLTLSLALATTALAQTKAPAGGKPDPAAMANPISSFLKNSYGRVTKNVLASAELMPAEDYAFKPTPEVRSYGQLLGHIADASWMFCSTAKGEKLAKKESAEKLTSKAEVEKALKEAFAYCDKIYADSTDASLTSTMIQMFGMTMPKFGALDINISHDNEHYGNIVTYLRLKKLTPPSSAGH